jgi:FlaA1/EpsC-like NDP-sugar epimerase
MRFIPRFLNSLSRRNKKTLLFGADIAMVAFGLFSAFALRFGMLFPVDPILASWPLYPTMCFVGAAAIYLARLHQIKLHAMDHSAFLRIGSTAAVLSLIAMGLSFMLGLSSPRSIPLIFGAVFFLSSVLVKVVALHVLLAFGGKETGSVKVAIYGAGAAGIQLAAALRQSDEARPCFFVDENPNLHGLLMNGLPVLPPKKLFQNVKKQNIGCILLAMPSIGRTQRNQILQELSKLSVEVMILPSYVDLMADGGMEQALRPVTPDELLGRDKVELDIPEIAKAYAGRTIMVTGAGGSIGSELCRQLLNRGPAKIVLFEQSEFSLYSIDREIRAMVGISGKPIEIVTKLGSVTNRARVQGVVRGEGVDIILHAAAYKHVPLVESNELEGAKNNVLGTQVVSDVAADEKIERFIFVSTDKAVRPTNVMGATKRMAELVVQDTQTRSPATKFAMVRFGNVLGSSGSVLPLFESQIRAGGPVTVTHPDVTRFFMTIPEAARLVLLAGAYSKGGDFFVLDMGKPQKIVDIARKMIQLSGRTVKETPDGTGDIELKIVGLRPGEKLYEELLIDDDSLVATPHPKILRAHEAQLSEIEVAAMLKEISSAIITANPELLRQTIKSRVDGYHQPVDGAELSA